jgi:hypothetical protein
VLRAQADDDGLLPYAFDPFVRETFAPLLEPDRSPAQS